MDSITRTPENIRQILAGFDSVWRRVSDGAPSGMPRGALCAIPPESAETQTPLRRLAEAAAAAHSRNRALAQRLRGSAGASLLSRAAQMREACARLSAELFLRCGERLPPLSPPRLPEDTLEALREGMLLDREFAAQLEAASESEADPALRPLLLEYACRSRAAASEKRELILRRFR